MDRSPDAQRLNQQAAHDAGIYDPTVHDNHVVAMYETRARAEAAREMLQQQGAPAAAFQIIGTETAVPHPHPDDRPSGVWGAIESLFFPASDRADFAHAIGRGHVMLVITPQPGMDRHAMIRTLEATGPIDFDAKLEEWRQAGYDTLAQQPPTPPPGRQSSAVAGTREQAAGPVRSYYGVRTDRPAMDDPRGMGSSGAAPDPATPPARPVASAAAGIDEPLR